MYRTNSSLMKLRRLYGAGFTFTAVEEFNIPFPNGILFSEKSVNDVLYIWESTSLVSNAVTTRSASRKRKIVEVQNDVKDAELEDVNPQPETFRPNTQPIGERELQREPSSSSSPISSQRAKPLYCSPNQLWHLRFSHASTTTLCKLPYIKSSHDSTHCIICIRAKQTHKLFHQSENKVSYILERVHSDICEPFPTSKGLTKLLLTFL